MEVSHTVYVRKKSTSGVGYLTPSQFHFVYLLYSTIDGEYRIRSIGFFMKLFITSDMEVIKFCQSTFNFVLPTAQIAKRRDKCVKKLIPSKCHYLSFILCSSSLKSSSHFVNSTTNTSPSLHRHT